jgi:hypothetical protein
LFVYKISQTYYNIKVIEKRKQYKTFMLNKTISSSLTENKKTIKNIKQLGEYV